MILKLVYHYKLSNRSIYKVPQNTIKNKLIKYDRLRIVVVVIIILLEFLKIVKRIIKMLTY